MSAPDYSIPSDAPGGSWQHTARNVKIYGNTLTAELQAGKGGSWWHKSTLFEPGQTFDNINGSFVFAGWHEKPEDVMWPTKIEGVDKPLLQTLATVCAKLYDEALYPVWKPAGGSEPDDKLYQRYEMIKPGGQYKPGGKYIKADKGSFETVPRAPQR